MGVEAVVCIYIAVSELLCLIKIYYALTESYEEDRRKVQEYTTLKSSRYGEFFSCIVQ